MTLTVPDAMPSSPFPEERPAVVAALCTEALGKDRVIGVLLPKGQQFDIDVSRSLVSHLGIRSL